MGMRSSSSWLYGESEASLGSIRPRLKNKMNIEVSVLSFMQLSRLECWEAGVMPHPMPGS